MADKIYAPDMDFGEWKEYTEKELGEPAYRAGQICQWIWQKRADSPEDMTNLSKQLRDKLAEKLDFAFPQLAREQKSADGTRKFLWRLRDGESVESVLMKQGDRLTACISTQVGCPLQCTFCATGLSGFVRNLSAGEIAGQVAAIEKKIGREINNVVYMGMGEPFLNTEAVLKSIRMLNDPKLRNLGIRHITVSTSGVIPGIRALAESGLGVRLAISLHAADGELRSMIMPVNNSYPVEELREALVDYQETTGDRITIEYALFGGVNDSVERARARALPARHPRLRQPHPVQLRRRALREAGGGGRAAFQERAPDRGLRMRDTRRAGSGHRRGLRTAAPQGKRHGRAARTRIVLRAEKHNGGGTRRGPRGKTGGEAETPRIRRKRRRTREFRTPR